MTVSISPVHEKSFIGTGVLKARVIESSGTPPLRMLWYLSLCLTDLSIICLTSEEVRSFE